MCFFARNSLINWYSWMKKKRFLRFLTLTLKVQFWDFLANCHSWTDILKRNLLLVYWFLAKNLAFKNPPSLKLLNRRTSVFKVVCIKKIWRKIYLFIYIFIVLGVDCDLPQPWTPCYWPYVVDFCIYLGSNSLLT